MAYLGGVAGEVLIKRYDKVKKEGGQVEPN